MSKEHLDEAERSDYSAVQLTIHPLFESQQELRIALSVKGRGLQNPKPKLRSKAVPLPQCTARERSREQSWERRSWQVKHSRQAPSKGTKGMEAGASGEGALSGKNEVR